MGRSRRSPGGWSACPPWRSSAGTRPPGSPGARPSNDCSAGLPRPTCPRRRHCRRCRPARPRRRGRARARRQLAQPAVQAGRQVAAVDVEDDRQGLGLGLRRGGCRRRLHRRQRWRLGLGPGAAAAGGSAGASVAVSVVPGAAGDRAGSVVRLNRHRRRRIAAPPAPSAAGSRRRWHPAAANPAPGPAAPARRRARHRPWRQPRPGPAVSCRCPAAAAAASRSAATAASACSAVAARRWADQPQPPAEHHQARATARASQPIRRAPPLHAVEFVLLQRISGRHRFVPVHTRCASLLGRPPLHARPAGQWRHDAARRSRAQANCPASGHSATRNAGAGQDRQRAKR